MSIASKLRNTSGGKGVEGKDGESKAHEQSELTSRKEKVVSQLQKTDLNPSAQDIKNQAKKLVDSELMAYSDGMRQLKESVKRSFKNYLGIFDEPFDPYTGRKKIFTALTHNIVDQVAKPISVSGKSVRITAKTYESRGNAKLANMLLPYFFQEMDFDRFMKSVVHRTAWLGHQVVAVDWLYEEKMVSTSTEASEKRMLGMPSEQKDKTKARKIVSDRPRIRMIDLMDVFMPPSAEDIYQAVKNASVIIRSVVPLSAVLANPAYDEEARSELKGYFTTTDGFNDSTSLQKYALAGYAQGETKGSKGDANAGSTSLVAVYERYGPIPQSWLNKEGTNASTDEMLTMVPGIVTGVSDSASGENVRIMSVRLSPFGDTGPFCENVFNKIPGRCFGEGLAERLIPSQAWHNEVVNNRRNNEMIAQHGMYKARKGSVDPRSTFSRPGGIIFLDNLNDIEALAKPDVLASSFNEDASIESAAQRMAGIAMAPIQKKVTATEASQIQQTSNMTYSELRDSTEGFLERLMTKNLLPLLKKYFKGKKIIPIDVSKQDMSQLDTYNGYAPFETEALGEERYLMVDCDGIFDGDFAVTADIEGVVTRQGQINAIDSVIARASKMQNSGVNIQYGLRKIAELSGIFDDRLFEQQNVPMPSGVPGLSGADGAAMPPVPGQEAMGGMGMPPEMAQQMA